MPLYFNQPSPYWTNADRGYLAETYPGDTTSAQTVMAVAGTMSIIRLKLLRPASVTNVVLACQAAGGTLTSGQCFAALYDSAGARVGVTADQAVAWATTGVKSMALASGPFSCAAGEYYVGFWYNGTTGPTWHRSGNITGTVVNVGRASPNFISGTADAGLTTTSPATLAAQTASATMWWAALS